MCLLQRIVKEEGFFKGLYEGFSFVLARQVLFGMVKFLVFDTFATWIYSLLPFFAESQATQVHSACVSGPCVRKTEAAEERQRHRQSGTEKHRKKRDRQQLHAAGRYV